MADDKAPYHERYRAAPPPDYMRYLSAPFEGYWKRQQRIAGDALAVAEDGAKRAQQGDLSGYLGKFLGPVGYVSSPVTALFPTDEEIYSARDLPDWMKPVAAGVVGAGAAIAPGPKMKGLGRGINNLADDVTDAERAALAARLETEAAQTGGQASSVTRDQALTNLTEAPQGITAYHGSPHTFDKFSMEKIGTGEGAQAYGHGLYFAENEKVAKGYRDALAGGGGATPKDTAIRVLDSSGGDVEAAIAELRARIDNANARGADQEGVRNLMAAKTALITQREGVKGATYQVRLNVKPDELLDWDRPLSEQPQSVRDALKAAGAVGPKNSDWSATGGKLLETQKTDPEFAADMRAQGIKGIRYKDAGSRDKDGGTYNYVIFDDKLVSILKRYAIPFTLGAGGAAVVSGKDMPPELAAQMGPEA